MTENFHCFEGFLKAAIVFPTDFISAILIANIYVTGPATMWAQKIADFSSLLS